MQRLIVSAQALGAFVKEQRKKRKLTQRQLGEQMGIDQATISNVEKGAPGVRLSTILSLLSVLESDLVLQTRDSIKEDKNPEDTW